ncbi:hypothetical protein BJ973_001736 [Actinoplanes tereljensis]|uniref:2TM domain-containing protein n=1 Tax=Paractinoplanes tereljensis TaxID=571912 RepID=A0A919TRJ8_9ACTN|nr:2TM domain-containing protein [Actinoplanes tereljensis]GIF20358.1 hypothetical protein Ate02nite_30880 [Actinoplanes tereljensis]
MNASSQDPVRARAIQQLNRKRGVQAHVLIYLLANLIQVIVWWAYTPDQFFWPLWSILGWGIGLVFHIWAIYSSSSLDEDRIEQEINRIQRGRPS